MALKDWRKIRDMKVVTTWTRSGSILEAFNEYGGWTVTKYSEKGSTLKRGVRKGFKTKTQALTYAKAYMKTH